jgi:hypothetical protein
MNTYFQVPHPASANMLAWLRRGACLLAAISMVALTSSAQTDSPPQGDAPTPGANASENAARWRGNFNPEEMQARILAHMRTQFAVADDAEWKLISDRILKVMELRRSVGGPGFGMVMFRDNRPGATANPEADALRTAIEDKLPEAEIKARLERLRDARKQAEVRLNRAREDLRSILTVRQEAVAVLMGLLQ